MGTHGKIRKRKERRVDENGGSHSNWKKIRHSSRIEEL